jgi:hypothetical protein
MTPPSLFADAGDRWPDQPPSGQPPAAGAPRLRRVERHPVAIRCASLDQLLPPDHQARIVWAYVEKVEISPLLASSAVASR